MTLIKSSNYSQPYNITNSYNEGEWEAIDNRSLQTLTKIDELTVKNTRY